jgi:hypothetical protein
MRNLLLSITLLFFAYANGQLENPFQLLKYDGAVMYDYEQAGENPSLIDGDGRIIKSVHVKKQIQLEKATIDELAVKLCSKSSFGNSHADCFEPHLGIVYYWHDKAVADILICMDCNRLSSSIHLPDQRQGQNGSGQNLYYLADGMSKSFRKFLNTLLIKYDFSHQAKPRSQFDK